MAVDANGIFKGVNFWKFGCNWGSKKPSFYDVVKKHNIVLHTDDKEEYLGTDIILICEGHSVRALAQVNGNREKLSSNSSLKNELLLFDVIATGDLYYYPINFQEIPSDQQFHYELQQGRIQVRDFATKKRTSQLWSDLFLEQIDKRIMRLTWNSNNWETPCGHSWHPKNQRNSAIAYENQYGFGHEEWLFNERFRIGGYQYGYIRGVNNLSEDVEFLDQITLYTIRDDKQRCLVGNIHNVEIIEGYEEEEEKIENLIASYMPSMLDELKKVNADYDRFKNDYLLPNVKFKWDEADLFNEPFSVDFLDGAEFNRFQAYRLQEELEVSIEREFVKKVKFDFQHGKASNTAEYTKSISNKKTKVKRRHGEITDDLYDYLISQGFKKENISVEKTRVGGAIVDVVLKHDEEFDLFEVKTSNTALKNIRQALGQIFEYALMDGEITCKRLVIIGPAELKEQEKDYFNRLKDLIQMKLEYWGYRSQEKVMDKKFIIE
tara:strand:- start:521 stop:1996 length:1476 start_codon:yes stop_codon:yes gene_type:complete